MEQKFINSNIGNYSATLSILKQHNFALKKKYGQNFLIDNNVLEEIANSADISSDDIVLEIGPGIGSLTQYLASSAHKVFAVEIDQALIPILNETLKDYDNVEVINEDILKFDFNQIDSSIKFKVVANLPYYVTTPIIMKLLEMNLNISSITIMIQSEVADRIKARPGSKDYGALTLGVNYYCDVFKVMDVSRNCFIPSPNVDSSVVRLEVKDDKLKVKDEKFMFKIIRASFNNRRKTLVNALMNSGILTMTKEEIENKLIELGFDIRIRGEKLSLEDFAKLSDSLS